LEPTFPIDPLARQFYPWHGKKHGGFDDTAMAGKTETGPAYGFAPPAPRRIQMG
jgi:hypothetical protein